MWHKSFIVAALALGFLVAGCGSQEGETLFTAGPGSENVAGKATRDGTYLLYTAFSPNPTLTVKLKEGEPLGFRKAADGRIEAFWGSPEQTHAFDKGTSQVYWKVQK